MILTAIAVALIQGLFLGELAIFSQMMNALFSAANLSIEICIGLIGILCFWMGLLKVAEHSGMMTIISRGLNPLFKQIMPEIPKNHPALGHISMNMAANIFGLDNAATPAGIKAMQSLQEVNQHKDTASNAQIMFLVLNTSSVTLFPVTILMYRAQQGAANPSDVFIPIILATTASTLVGLFGVMWVQKISLFNKVLLGYLAAGLSVIGLLMFSLSTLPPEQMAEVSGALGNGILLAAIFWFIVMALYKKVAVYDSFIEGAKQGFFTAVGIMPYLVAMLVAVSLLRASGILDSLLVGVTTVFATFNLNTQFVDALPTAIMNPLSGSGARALMLETMNNYGVDSFAARLASIFQGSTETTFYVLTVYFGAVNIKHLRHAIGCGLLADLGGIVAAILVCYWFFG